MILFIMFFMVVFVKEFLHFHLMILSVFGFFFKVIIFFIKFIYDCLQKINHQNGSYSLNFFSLRFFFMELPLMNLNLLPKLI